ncbi:transmembrane 220 family protein [Spongiimicrobium salis]|uniref:transmembrane 220 family protein n=1 Tax=Spongiimicrobium salis TaxID=1667022 RepID=UPI00374D3E87
MNIIFKGLSLVFAILFIWSAYVQYNDPDAMLWYVIYGVAALASLLFFMGKLKRVLSLSLGIAYLVYALSLWPDKFEGVTIGEGDIVNIERGREALGMLIVSLVMLLYAARTHYLVKKSKV